MRGRHVVRQFCVGTDQRLVAKGQSTGQSTLQQGGVHSPTVLLFQLWKVKQIDVGTAASI